MKQKCKQMFLTVCKSEGTLRIVPLRKELAVHYFLHPHAILHFLENFIFKAKAGSDFGNKYEDTVC